MSFMDDMKKAYAEGKEKGREKGSFEYRADKIKEKQSLRKEERQEKSDKLKELKQRGIVYCPKCKSTTVQYVERRKRLSLGRAAAGGALFGALGASVGAITSKKYKGFIKCLSCGHKWKK